LRLCPGCGATLTASGWDCGACGHHTPLRAGFPALAPELDAQPEGFDPQLFPELAELEARNFWFRARNALIILALKRYFPGFSNFLEIGCGTGYVLQGVAEAFPAAQLCATEAQTEGMRFAANRVPRAAFMQLDARRMPFDREFDVVGAFDVIEHIDDDHAVLGGLYRAANPGGGVLLTVPQHPFLWSEYDVRAHHVRRYTADELKRKIEQAGFRIARMTSFVSLLLPLMLISRRARNTSSADYDPLAELRIGGAASTLLELVLGFERLLIRSGLSLPFGGSLLVVAQKPA